MSSESGETSDQTQPDLDWKSQEILRAIHKNDGSANTSEVRTLTGIDNNDTILYRFREKLAPHGLITLEQPESDTAKPEPKVATFTQRGVEVAERLIESRGDQSLTEDYVEQLEAKITRLETRIDELEADDRRSEDQDQAARAETVEQLTASKYGAWSDTSTQHFTEVFCGMLALRDYLLEHSDLTRDELDERMAQAKTDLETTD